MKKKILATLLCTLPLLLLFFIHPALGSGNWASGIDLATNESGLPEGYVGDVVFTVLRWLLTIFTFLSVLAFVIAGIMFITAGANTQQATQAKDYVKYAVTGIAVGLSGYIIIRFINEMLIGYVNI